jgi:hypothetical protein
LKANDLSLAKEIANNEYDEDLRKQLWLWIVQHAIKMNGKISE